MRFKPEIPIVDDFAAAKEKLWIGMRKDSGDRGSDRKGEGWGKKKKSKWRGRDRNGGSPKSEISSSNSDDGEAEPVTNP